jgi:hypothetical protein
MVLVGTKTDLRQDKRTIDLLAAQGQRPIDPGEPRAFVPAVLLLNRRPSFFI